VRKTKKKESKIVVHTQKMFVFSFLGVRGLKEKWSHEDLNIKCINV
jgi:hypothetical protein